MAKKAIERRFIPTSGAELRVEGEGEGRRIIHHAPQWELLSLPLWHERRGDSLVPVRERFIRGAFSELVATDVVGLRDHDASRVLGRTTAGTLTLEEDETGLRYEIDPPDTSDGRDILVLIDRGDVRGSSFSFRVEEEEWDETDEAIVRTVTKASYLGDVGPVTFPAYPDGKEISLRSRGCCDDAVERFEAWRQAGAVQAGLLARRRRQRLLAVR